MSWLLFTCILIGGFLSAYSLGFYFCCAVFLASRPNSRRFDAYPIEAVTVMIPARNEGALAVQAIQSVLEQDHHGRLDIYLLIKDLEDSSVSFLRECWSQCYEPESGEAMWQTFLEHKITQSQRVIKIHRQGDRTVYLAQTGLDPKSEKINWMVRRIATPYVAILDCDHCAFKDWIRTSLILMTEQDAEMVQAQRHPFSTKGFFEFWDSMQQHIGNEINNVAFSSLGLTLFFTGSTAVLNTNLLKSQPLSNSITEDTDFSYGMFMHGLKIIGNPFSGSCEETAPDLYSFLVRRRRWANGHTGAFFQYLPFLLSSNVKWRDRVQFLFHGTHYLIVIGIFFLQLLISVSFIETLTPFSVMIALFTGLMSAIGLMHGQRKQALLSGTREGVLDSVLEVLLLSALLAPAFIVLMVLLNSALMFNPAIAVLPIGNAVKLFFLVGICAPCIVLILGLVVFRQLSLKTLGKIFLTYPFAFYINLSGILLGLFDFLRGHNHWRVVSRAKDV